MSTVRDLIKRSLRLINAVPSGETPSADEFTDAFTVLKDMLASWSTEKLIINAKVREEFPLVASQGSYTMGDTGDFDTVRPMQIEGASVLENGAEIPIEILNLDQWQAVAQKDMSGSRPAKLFAEGTSPLETINIWPVPSSVITLFLYSHKPLTDFASVNDDIEFPPGYARAISYNLAIELCPEFGKSATAEIIKIADESKGNIKRMNIKSTYLEVDPALLGNRRFNILTGE